MHEVEQFQKQISPPPGTSPREPEQGQENGRETKAGSTAPGGGLFSDVESMKQKLRQNMTKPQYDVADFYVKSGLFQYIARHKVFEMGTLSVIAFNALWISIDTDHNGAEMLLQAQPIFQIAEHFFCAYFSFEWFCRYMSFKRKRDGLKDAWFVFDSIMVFMMVVETWLMTIILLATGASSGGGGMGNASILRLARLLRLSRMMRMARLLRAMPELLILIKGMVAAMRSVCFTLALLAILVYVFGIMFTQLTVDSETHVHDAYFRTVPLSMHTLLLDGALMDGVGQVVRDLGDESLVFAGVFYIFVLLAALTMMNMLIGVLCEVVSAVASTEKEELTVNYVKEKLQEVILTSGLDQDGDGQISKKEFAKIIEIPEAANTLTEVGIDVVGLVDLSDFIFEGADEEEGDGGDKVLTFLDFLEVILQLRGSNTATVKDIVDLRKFVRNSNKSLEDRMEAVMRGERRGHRGSRMTTVPKRSQSKSTTHPEGSREPSPRPHTAASIESGGLSSNDESECHEREKKRVHPNGTGSYKGESAHKSEEKLWVRAGKLEELLLAVQHELANFTEAMTGISGFSSRVTASRPGTSFSLGSSGNSITESNTPTNTYARQNWEVAGSPPPYGGSGSNVRVPGVPDSVLPPTRAESPSNSVSGDQLEDLRRQLGSLEQSLLASMGGLHAVRSKLGGFARSNAVANGAP